jgi:hypothetical protein
VRAAPTIVLRSDDVLVRIDPQHGGEVLDLIDLRSNRQLLGRPPFASEPPRSGDLDEAAWTASYRGGWQLLTPNAGSACEVDGGLHGFHGRASNDPWTVQSVGADRAVLRWNGHGLVVRREYSVTGATLCASVHWEAVARTPLVAVEHVALGLELLDPEVVIELPSGLAYEMDERAGPARAPAGSPRWPGVRLADGTIEHAGRWARAEPRSRLTCVQDVEDGFARITNVRSGAGVIIEWEVDKLPHLWMWHEARRSGGPWRCLTELLVIEPASVPHHQGLAAAIAHDQATWVGPGQGFGYRVSVTAVPGGGYG